MLSSVDFKFFTLQDLLSDALIQMKHGSTDLNVFFCTSAIKCAACTDLYWTRRNTAALGAYFVEMRLLL